MNERSTRENQCTSLGTTSQGIWKLSDKEKESIVRETTSITDNTMDMILEMPMEWTSITKEHQKIRENMGLERHMFRGKRKIGNILVFTPEQLKQKKHLFVIFCRTHWEDVPNELAYEQGMKRVFEEARSLGIQKLAVTRMPMEETKTKTWDEKAKWLKNILGEDRIRIHLHEEIN
jgi:hypothetical protein